MITRREKARIIINYYGAKHQLKKLSEEHHEFTEAVYECLSKKRHGEIISFSKRHVEEELADIFVVLEQFIEYLDLDLGKVQQIMNKKRDRTIERMILSSDKNKKFLTRLYLRIKRKLENAVSKMPSCTENIYGDKLR